METGKGSVSFTRLGVPLKDEMENRLLANTFRQWGKKKRRRGRSPPITHLQGGGSGGEGGGVCLTISSKMEETDQQKKKRQILDKRGGKKRYKRMGYFSACCLERGGRGAKQTKNKIRQRREGELETSPRVLCVIHKEVRRSSSKEIGGERLGVSGKKTFNCSRTWGNKRRKRQ